MSKTKPDNKTNFDEFSRIFDEYRARIQEITHKAEKNLPSGNEPIPHPNDSIGEKLEEIVVSKLAEARAPAQNAKVMTSADAAAIIEKARREAQQIIEEAEESARKEAKKRVKAQEEKILEKARDEAEDIIQQARKDAEKEKTNIIEAARKRAEFLVGELTERCRQETQLQAARVIAEAREQAGKMMDDVIASSTEISRLVTEIINRARTSFYEFETKLQKDTDELIKAIAETQNLLKQISAPSEEVKRPLPLKPIDRPSENLAPTEPIPTSPALVARLLGEKSNGKNGTEPLFRGQVEMRSVSSSFDYQYLKSLKKYLIQFPKIKYLQESASEDETSILFEIQEPLPLMELFRNIPMVDHITTEADGITIVFKETRGSGEPEV